MKKTYTYLLILSLTIANCINITSICNARVNNTLTSNNTTIADRLQRIKSKGVLTIASTNTPPFSFINTETGKVTGLDGDIITEVTRRLGINNVALKYIPFDKLFTEALLDDDIDMIVDSTYITDDRKKVVSFTHPWYKDYEVIITPKISKIVFEEDLINASAIGVQVGTAAANLAQKLKEEGRIKDFTLFLNQKDLLLAINNGQIEAGISDAITGLYAKTELKSLYIRALSPKEYKSQLTGQVAAAVRQSDVTLLDAVNAKIDEIKIDKTLPKILYKYGLDDSFLIPVK